MNTCCHSFLFSDEMSSLSIATIIGIALAQNRIQTQLRAALLVTRMKHKWTQ